MGYTRELRHDHHGCRLCVRQRAEAADRIEELEAALREAEAIIEAMNGNWVHDKPKP